MEEPPADAPPFSMRLSREEAEAQKERATFFALQDLHLQLLAAERRRCTKWALICLVILMLLISGFWLSMDPQTLLLLRAQYLPSSLLSQSHINPLFHGQNALHLLCTLQDGDQYYAKFRY